MTQRWWTQFANDPRDDFNLNLELLEGQEARGMIRRDVDGELYLSIFAAPDVRVPFRWLINLAERAESLPDISNGE